MRQAYREAGLGVSTRVTRVARRGARVLEAAT
jgi:hypothetical protein